MRTGTAIFGFLLTLPFGCAKISGAVSHIGATRTDLSICSVLQPDAHFDDPHVTVRAEYYEVEYGVILYDSNCRDKTLYLEPVRGAPWFLFSKSDRLTQEFGYPPGLNEPIVTVRGVLLRPDRNMAEGVGTLVVEEVLAYESTRTGKRVEP